MSNPASGSSGGASLGQGESVAGTALQVYGDWVTGQSNKNLANYQAGVAQQNALLAQQNAIYAMQTGEVEAQQSGLATRAQVGATKAGIGAGNISISGGSASKVIGSETTLGQTNEGIIRANAAKRAYGFNVSGAEDTAQAGLFKAAATTAGIAEDVSITQSIVGGAGSVSSKWLQASQAGVGSANYNSSSDSSNYNPNVTGGLY